MHFKQRITIFCYYDKEGVFGNDSIYLTKELKKISSKLIIVVNGEIKNKCDIEFADKVIVRENLGYDIGAFKTAIIDTEVNSLIRQSDELILCNSSFYGPFVPFDVLFNEASIYDWDLWGISENKTGINNHIQSYFIVYRKPVIQSKCFYEYFDFIDESKETHTTSCVLFENGFLNYLVYNGFKWGALRSIRYHNIKNPLDSIAVDGIPILKKKVFENNSTSPSTKLALAYLNNKSLYDCSLILEDVKRRYGYYINIDSISNIKGNELIEEDLAKGVFNNENINRFIEENDSVYIYGCGDLAARIYSTFFFFTKNADKLAGFIVSDNQYIGSASFFNNNVYHLAEIRDTSAAIIVALNHKNTNEVKPGLSYYANVFYITQDYNDKFLKKMVSNAVLNVCKNGETPIIRGFGNKGKLVIDCFNEAGINYVISDADERLQDKLFEGYGTIRSSAWIKENVKNPVFFITSTVWFETISNELNDLFPLAPIISADFILNQCNKCNPIRYSNFGVIENKYVGNDEWFDTTKLEDIVTPDVIDSYNRREIVPKLYLNSYFPEEYKRNKYNVAVCGIFKDEGLYLKEWIDYHIYIGIDHFYLYNNNSSDHFREILSPYVASGKVTLIDWPKDQAQLEAYDDCIAKFRFDCDWIGFIDLDEFVVIKDGSTINDFLKPFKKNRPAVLFYWKIFGSNGYDSRDLTVPVTEAFHSCNPMFNTNGKCFYNTSYYFDRSVCTTDSFHHRLFAKCRNVILPPVNVFDYVSYRKWNIVDSLDFPAWINHYAVKSRHEYCKRMNKTDVFYKESKHDLSYFNYYNSCCIGEDYTIQEIRNKK